MPFNRLYFPSNFELSDYPADPEAYLLECATSKAAEDMHRAKHAISVDQLKPGGYDLDSKEHPTGQYPDTRLVIYDNDRATYSWRERTVQYIDVTIRGLVNYRGTAARANLIIRYAEIPDDQKFVMITMLNATGSLRIHDAILYTK